MLAKCGREYFTVFCTSIDQGILALLEYSVDVYRIPDTVHLLLWGFL